MSTNKVLVKRSAVPAKVPTTSDLELGEIAINTFDGKMYIKQNSGTPAIIEIGAGGGGVYAADLAINNNTFSGNSSTVAFTLSVIPTSTQYVLVSLDGVIQSTATYTVAGNVLTFSTAPPTGSSIETRVISGKSSSVTLRDYKKYIYNITSTVTVITGADYIGNVLLYDLDAVDVYQNGFRLVEGQDYTTTSTSTITLITAALNTDVVEVLSYGRAYINDGITSITAEFTTLTVNQVVDTFQAGSYTTAQYICQIKSGASIDATTILIMYNGTNVYITEYATMSSGTILGAFSADVLNGAIRLLYTPNNINTNVKVKRITVAA